MGCLFSKPKKKHYLGENFVVERYKNVEVDYKIVKQIGKGSIGVIYLAESRRPKYCDDLLSTQHFVRRSKHGNNDSSLTTSSGQENTKVQFAIKEIDASMLEERAFESLQTEIQLLRNLDHPFIIKFFGTYHSTAGVGREKLSVVMEYCRGGALDKHVPYKEETAKVLVANVVEAVLYLHRHHIIHRDVKGENIMFADDKRDPNNIRLLDFGLAKRFSASQQLHDRAGTIYAMSPEALRGDYNEKADMWSIGILAYYLLSGKRPFWGETKNEIARNVCSGRYSFAGPEWRDISGEAKLFIRQLLQSEPIVRSNPVEALKSCWLISHTEFNIKTLSKEELGVLKIVKEYDAPLKEMRKLALYAIAHKARTEDMSKLRRMFLRIAKNKNCEIRLYDMKQVLKGDFTEEEIEAWFRRADIDESGTINFSEFVASSLDAQSVLSSQDVIDAFRIFDRDDTGYITPANLREALQTDEGEYIDQLIKDMDLAGDGRISCREFCNCLMRNRLTAPPQSKEEEISAK